MKSESIVTLVRNGKGKDKIIAKSYLIPTIPIYIVRFEIIYVRMISKCHMFRNFRNRTIFG